MEPIRPAPDREALRALLNRLPGVYAAGVRFDEGALREIHVLASNARNPKQIVRDVQSALLAAYDLEVDHRIVSVALLSGDPTADGEEEAARHDGARLKILGASVNARDGRYQVRVILGCEGQTYEGEAACRDSAAQRMRAVAEATLEAVHAYLGREAVFSLIAARSVDVAGAPVALCMVEYLTQNDGRVLIGAAQQRPGEADGVIKATLDALNRSIGREKAAG